MDLNQRAILDSKFDWFYQLLLTFYPGLSNPGEITDRDIIAEFVTKTSDSFVQQALLQGKELLALDEFPCEWVGDTAYRLPLLNGSIQHILEPTSENYYSWVKWIVEELEREAKRQGKL